MSYRLVPLECSSCGASLAAENEDVVYYCTACRNGYRFDPEQEQLEPTEVGFISAPHVAADLYRPFWLLPAKLDIRNRDAVGGGLAGLFSFFMGGVDSTGFPAGEGRFAVPAFQTPLPALTELTRRYSLQLPHLGRRGESRATLQAGPFRRLGVGNPRRFTESPAGFRLDSTKNSSLSLAADFHHGLLAARTAWSERPPIRGEPRFERSSPGPGPGPRPR